MSAKYQCDGCGCDVTHGSRITVTAEGFEWGNETEHFCSAPCVVGRYDSTAGLDNLMKQYKQIKIAVKVPPVPY